MNIAPLAKFVSETVTRTGTKIVKRIEPFWHGDYALTKTILYPAGSKMDSYGISKVVSGKTPKGTATIVFGKDGKPLMLGAKNPLNNYEKSITTQLREYIASMKKTVSASIKSDLLKALNKRSYINDKNTVLKLIDENPDLVDKMAQAKDPSGKALLDSGDMVDLLYNSQHGFLNDGPIKNYQAKIKAVLSNPKEVADIAGCKSKAFGIWRAIQDPFDSTIKANPEIFA